ncbi:MAG: PEP-CTERM sorting domain-containing protein [Tepidisphaeraceae bacterium]
MRQSRSFKSLSRYSLGAPVFGVVAMFTSAAPGALLYNPVVTQVGDGTTPLTTAGAPTTIQVYANGLASQPAPLAQLAYANGALVNAGSSFTEGQLANNPGVADAATAGLPYAGTAYVFSAGYAAKYGTPAVASAATNANRVVGDMTVTAGSVSNANIALSQPQGSTYAGSNIRAAVGDDSVSNFWTAGTSSTLPGTAGYKYFNTNVALQNAVGPTNTRTIQIRQGQLYGSSDTGSFVGISLIGSGTPQVGGQTITPLFTTGTSAVASPEAFSLIDNPSAPTPTIGGVNVPFNVAYIADSNAGNGNSQPGIQKWVYSTSTTGNNGWSLAYVISDSATGAPDGYNGLAAELVKVPVIGAAGGLTQDDIVLFATNTTNTATGGNSLEEFIDPLVGGSAGATDATLITLANAPANDEFRGVALAPVPEPAGFALAGLALFGLLVRRRRAGGA